MELHVVFLGVTVTLVGALCLLDLLLTFGVIRRLREHTEMLSWAGRPDMPVIGPVIGLASGEPVAAFSALTLGGELLTGTSGLRVAGFFSSACPACPERVGPFADYLADHRVARESVLSVVVAPDDGMPSYADRLNEAGRVCAVREDSDVLKAFKVSGFPAFCLLDVDGGLVTTSYDPATLPAPAAAA
jgi:hypothetical protein